MFDPVTRGPHPVGVRSETLADPARDGRRLPLELYYPAAERYRGHDFEPKHQDRYQLFGGHQVRQEAVRDAATAEGSFPLVIFSHGFAGHRRQSSFFCTHLASHGYLVIALDHTGNTLIDIITLVTAARADSQAGDPEHAFGRFVHDRPRDLSFVLDAIEQSVLVPPLPVEVERVGLCGHSFGGWTTLVASQRDARVAAALALAPAGGSGPLASASLTRELDLSRARHVDTLVLAADRDSLLPLDGIVEIFRQAQGARMLVLCDADHMHFCDRVERSHEFFRVMPNIGPMRAIAERLPPLSELVPGDHGYRFTNALGVIHFDAVLKRRPEACALREGDLLAFLAGLGIRAQEIPQEGVPRANSA